MDLNDDGWNDVVSVFRQGLGVDLNVILGLGKGFFQVQRYPTSLQLNSFPIVSIPMLTEDFNNDGIDDFVVLGQDQSEIGIRLGNSSGIMGDELLLPVGDGPTDMTSADFDLDGLIDIALVNRNSSDVSPSVRNRARGVF